MRLRRAIHAIILMWAACLTAGAQPQFVPAKTVDNVGEIMFQAPRRVNFWFTNTGTEPLIIRSVHPSCGCVAVEYPKEPVAPGKGANIAATYDAAMLGVFVKELEVMTNAADEPYYLVFQGKVATNPAISADDFPIDLDEVRLTANVVEFDDVNKGDKPIIELQVLNTGRQPYTPQLMHLPPYLTAEYIPQQLAAGRVGRIRIQLDSERLPSMGLNQTSVYLARHSGNKVGESNEVLVSAVLLPDFRSISPMSKVFAPRLRLSADTLRLADNVKKTKVTGIVEIRNEGRSALEISRLQAFNSAISVSLGSSKVKPGAKTRLKVTVDKSYLAKNKNRLRVLLITNDPDNPKKILPIHITGT